MALDVGTVQLPAQSSETRTPMRFAAFVPPQADKQPVATQASTLKNACSKDGVPLTLRMHEGYDHSYFFIPALSSSTSAGTRRG
jgi:S-formylglutathione hydrolase FrmB